MTALPAPLLKASIAIFPVPEYKSRNLASVILSPIILNIASFIRSRVGRVSFPSLDFIFLFLKHGFEQ